MSRSRAPFKTMSGHTVGAHKISEPPIEMDQENPGEMVILTWESCNITRLALLDLRSRLSLNPIPTRWSSCLARFLIFF